MGEWGSEGPLSPTPPSRKVSSEPLQLPLMLNRKPCSPRERWHCYLFCRIELNFLSPICQAFYVFILEGIFVNGAVYHQQPMLSRLAGPGRLSNPHRAPCARPTRVEARGQEHARHTTVQRGPARSASGTHAGRGTDRLTRDWRAKGGREGKNQESTEPGFEF